MSMNGITGYNAYAYSNPYAVNNNYAGAYTADSTPTFQGYNTSLVANTEETQEKNSGINPLLAIGGAIAAVGGTIYAIKKGKGINGADSSIFKNLKTGFSEIGKSILNKIKNVKPDTADANNLKQAAKEVENIRVPQSNEYVEKVVNNYQEAVLKPYNDILNEIKNKKPWETDYSKYFNK